MSYCVTARDDEDSKLVYDTIARLNNETVNIIDAVTRYLELI